MDQLTNFTQKLPLRNLITDISNALIVGIIIAKQAPRKLASDSSTAVSRGVWNFTIRDSVKDFINVTFWGPNEVVVELNARFHVGDVVDIIRPRVTIRKINDYGEQFRPMVTSPFALTLSEPVQIVPHEGSDYNVYTSLLQVPTKPIASFITLGEVQRRCISAAIFDLDVLGAVRSVGTVRFIKSKKQDAELQVREVTIFDQTSPGVQLTIWEPDLITRSGYWTPRQTILFLTNSKAELSRFHGTATLTITSRSILTENPVGHEADMLRNYAATAPLQPIEIMDKITASIPDPSVIQNVMSVQQILDRLAETPSGFTVDQHFTALLFAVVTNFDLDGSNSVVRSCANCSAVLPVSASTCVECPTNESKAGFNAVFNVRAVLSDHTGTLENCKLNGRVVENVVKCNALEFFNMDSEKKSNMKWQFLLERCAIRVVVLNAVGQRPLFTIISMELASPFEVANRLPHY